MSRDRHIALRRSGRGPRIILLHGWSMTGLAMAPLAERLAGFETLVPDLPGHGATRGFAPDLGGAAELLDLLLAEGGSVVLVGWSLGALIGWQRLARDPSGIAGMVSLDMSPRQAPDWACGMSGPAPEGLGSGAGWQAGARAIVQSLFAAGRPPAVVPDLTELVAGQDWRAMARFWAALAEADLRADLARIERPLLAIHGAQSRVYPPQTAAWIARTAPEARAHLLDGAGHAPHLECPEVTADLIVRFAREVVSR